MRMLATLPVLFVAFNVAACGVGTGAGSVKGELAVPDCWSGTFDLQPNFFGANPFARTLTIRLQKGSDLENFSDGLTILIDDIDAVRGSLGTPLEVEIPTGVRPPGFPIVTSNALAHASLYLQKTCHTQVQAAYATSVQLDSGGGCTNVPVDCGAAIIPGDGGLDGGAEAGTRPVAKSTVTFQAIFNGNIEEENAAERRNQGTFDLYLGDPRDTCPGSPPPCRGHITGDFDFYFVRGKPAQPFP